MNCLTHGALLNMKEILLFRLVVDNGASTSTANQRHVVEMLDASKRRMAHFRDDITDAMWADYVTRRH